MSPLWWREPGAGTVHFDDIDLFVEALSTGKCKWADFANCDVNGDGQINFDDIDAFIPLLGVPCPQVRRDRPIRGAAQRLSTDNPRAITPAGVTGMTPGGSGQWRRIPMPEFVQDVTYFITVVNPGNP